MLKYELIPEGELFRIKALKDFRDIKKGDLGGLIGTGFNLSQYGESWVYKGSIVDECVRVEDDSIIINSHLNGEGLIKGKTIIDNCTTGCFSRISTKGSAIIKNCFILGELCVFKANIISNVTVNNDCSLVAFKDSIINGCIVDGAVTVSECVTVSPYSTKKIIMKNGRIKNDIEFSYDSIGFFSLKKRDIIIYKHKNMFYCDIGCQKHMTLSDLERRIKEDGGMKPHRVAYVELMKIAHLLL